MKSTTKEKPAKEQVEKKARTTKSQVEAVEAEVAVSPKPARPIKKAAVAISLDQIAERAYLLWQSRGCVHGYHEQDWRQAEEELIRESNN